MSTTSIWDLAVDGRGLTSRRGFLRGVGLGAAGLSAMSFTDLLAARADDLRRNQMACIVLWMAGGPSQMETFDPKPDHANGAGTKTIETAIPGIRIAEGWNETAKSLGDVAVVRSMTNREGNHQRASYQMHTGYLPTGSVRHPGFGSNVAAELADPSATLPGIVTIGRSPVAVGSGFLGAAYEPFLVDDPNQPPRNVEPIVDRGRFSRRMGLLGGLERAGFGREGGSDRIQDHQALYAKTGSMIYSPQVKAFDLDGEDAATRDTYGRTPFGQGCLLARRLVEAGVTFVEVRLNGWDTHTDNKGRIATLAGQVDPAYAALLRDLKSRGMLDRTLVVWTGEFGRTPKMNPNGGRDHFPRAFNSLLAGGGIKGRQVVGSTSADGTEVKDRPVAVNDLLSTLCKSLKIDSTKENMSPQGRPIKIVDGGKPIDELFG